MFCIEELYSFIIALLAYNSFIALVNFYLALVFLFVEDKYWNLLGALRL